MGRTRSSVSTTMAKRKPVDNLELRAGSSGARPQGGICTAWGVNPRTGAGPVPSSILSCGTGSMEQAPQACAFTIPRQTPSHRFAPLPSPLRIQRLMGSSSGLDLMNLPGVAEAAEDGRSGARVHRSLQGGAVAAVGLLGHPVGSEGLVGEAVDHAGDQLAGHDPLADESAEVLRLLLLGRLGSHSG